MELLNSIKSEWLKTKRSLASWICLAGGFFIPLIFLIIFLKEQNSINTYNLQQNIWKTHFIQLWEHMLAFLLPLSLIMAGSLLTQIEFKNNTWKQLHTTPQTKSTIFFAKLSVIFLLTFKLFLFFNVGIILSGIIPSIIFDYSLPQQQIPFLFFIKSNIKYFIICMPVIAIQYLLSLNFRNFIIPIGTGMLAVFGTLMAASWKYIFISPYSFGIIYGHSGKINYSFILIYFLIITAINYVLYLKKKDKS